MNIDERKYIANRVNSKRGDPGDLDLWHLFVGSNLFFFMLLKET